MSEKPTVETINIEKIYILGKTEIHALRGVSLKAFRGEFIVVMGPSGSGKTTLLNIIGTLDKPTKGRVIIDGIDVTDAKESQLTMIRRSKVGFVFQFFNLIPTLTAYENVELPMIFAGRPAKERRRRVVHLLKLVGLEQRMNHMPDQLSGGERQRVAIARALANNPSIILADEPTGDLDSTTGKLVMEYLKKLTVQENTCTIVVTHDPVVCKFGTRILRMRDGKIVGEERNEQWHIW